MDEADVASGCSTTAKRAMAWLSVSSVVHFGEVRLPIILVALGSPTERVMGCESAEELLEIGGVLAGGVDADVEVDLRMLLANCSRAFPQGLIAGAILGDRERLGGGRRSGLRNETR